MAEKTPQNYENHRRFIPGYHLVTFGILALYFFWTLYQLVRGFSVATTVAALVAGALVSVALYVRIFVAAVQDRVIRLEERLCLSALVPEDLRDRIDDLTTAQYVGLRFASDGEAAELVRRVIDDGIDDCDEIKKLVVNWRPDYHRV